MEAAQVAQLVSTIGLGGAASVACFFLWRQLNKERADADAFKTEIFRWLQGRDDSRDQQA